MMLKTKYDVIVIGAGAAGVGIANILMELGVEKIKVLDREEVGASFRRWPKEMRFITPSFTSNFFAQMDLNSVVQGTSPAFTLRAEHPSGEQYAKYLQGIVEHFEIPVETGVNVLQIFPVSDGFKIKTNNGTYRSTYCIWAGGEFGFPAQSGFKGAELCQHTSGVGSYDSVAGDPVFIIGGYESGIDAAVNLAHQGKDVHVFDREGKWEEFSTDPSLNFSTYTYERLKAALLTNKLHLHAGVSVTEVEQAEDGYTIHTDANDQFVSDSAPLLATGFNVSPVISDLFDMESEDGFLNEVDESTKTDNLFMVGPQVKQDDLIFCFIYKFRQRFGVVAKAIGGRLGLDVSDIEELRRDGLFMDDLSCCGEECSC